MSRTRIKKLKLEHSLQDYIHRISSWRLKKVLLMAGLISPIMTMTDPDREKDIFSNIVIIIIYYLFILPPYSLCILAVY